MREALFIARLHFLEKKNDAIEKLIVTKLIK